MAAMPIMQIKIRGPNVNLPTKQSKSTPVLESASEPHVTCRHGVDVEGQACTAFAMLWHL